MDADLRAAEKRFWSEGSASAEADYARACARAGVLTQGRPVVAFLARLRGFAATARDPALRAAQLAHVAWAHVEVGELARSIPAAVEALQVADGGDSEYESYRARARARAGACHEHARGHGAGAASLLQALREVDSLHERHGEHGQGASDALKALVSVARSFADAAGSDADGFAEVVDGLLASIVTWSPRRQTMILSSCACDLVRLGAGSRAQALVRKLLSGRDLLVRSDGETRLMYVQDAAEALAKLLGEEPPTQQDGRRLIQLFLRGSEIDEHSLPLLKLALGAGGRPIWKDVQETRRELRNRHHAAALVTLAGLQRMAERGEHAQGPRLLAEIRRWSSDAGRAAKVSHEKRMRLIVRLARLVPAFGLGLAPLRQVLEWAVLEPDVRLCSELMDTAASAAASVGETEESFDLLATITDQAIRGLESGTAGPTWLLCNTLETCAESAAKLGTARGGQPLVGRVLGAARAELARDRGGGHQIGRFFGLKALLRSGLAAWNLGDHAAAEAAWSEALGRILETEEHDLTELIECAGRTAMELAGPMRFTLASRVVDVAERCLVQQRDMLLDRFRVDLVELLARGLAPVLECASGPR